MLIEAVAAVAVVTMTLIAVAQLISLSALQRRDAEQLRLAGLEVGNVMERLYALPWEELAGEAVSGCGVSTLVAARLDEPQLRIMIDASDSAVRTKRIRVELSWLNRAGERATPVVLTAWKHAAEGTR